MALAAPHGPIMNPINAFIIFMSLFSLFILEKINESMRDYYYDRNYK